MLEIQTILKNFQIDRPTMNQSNTLDFLLNLLKIEIQEFEEEPNEQELADLGIFVFNLANKMGVDLDKAIRTKVAYNHARYSASEFQTGDYDEARLKCKKTEVIWKPVFYPTNSPSTENEK